MKIICIGRNYADHAKELNNPIPAAPLIFMKPSSALLVNQKPLYYPEFTEELHYEAEVVLKIDRNGRHVQEEFAHKYYSQIALGIDFTARDIQRRCKAKGHPWEIAKGFDGSAALGSFVPLDEVRGENGIEFFLHKNGEEVQRGLTRDLLFPFDRLIVEVSRYFKLHMGDLIFTGTPAGVGPVQIGDELEGFAIRRGPAREAIPLLRCAIK
ncbi:MAG: fumarylacetoacetate hydrolase family protein [Bacteroidota bacterium]